MICAIDVFYKSATKGHDSARASAVLFNDWADSSPKQILSVDIDEVEPYVSGQFYRRELPCILALLEQLTSVSCVVVDGFVFLDNNKKGLGAYLYEALDQTIPIIGVAKNPYSNISEDCEVYRGISKKPLYVTAAGMTQADAIKHIATMHGEFRFPTLLKIVDNLCRS